MVTLGRGQMKRAHSESLVESPLTRILVAKMVLNIMVTEGMAPSLNEQ
jgi:hypothetical protein